MATQFDHVVLPTPPTSEAAVISLPLPTRRRFLRWPALWLNDRTRGMYFLNRDAGMGHLRARFTATAERWKSTTVELNPVVRLAVSWQELRAATSVLLFAPTVRHSLWWHLGYFVASLRPRYVWNDRRRTHDEALAEFKSIWGGG